MSVYSAEEKTSCKTNDFTSQEVSKSIHYKTNLLFNVHLIVRCH